jgi:hypothetical protein
MTDTLLYLPVSLGEAIDKLTILDIKLDKITDDRKNDVKNEYDLLHNKLAEFIIKYANLYQTMKKVNLLIWDMMDLLRHNAIDEQLYLKVCKDCIEYNDIRFRVKNKINYVSFSLLKEQKSYKINRVIIILKKDISLIISVFIQIIKYFSFMYDEINIVSDFNLNIQREYFSYDSTVLFKPLSYQLPDYKKIYTIESCDTCDEFEIYKLFDITENDITRF